MIYNNTLIKYQSVQIIELLCSSASLVPSWENPIDFNRDLT